MRREVSTCVLSRAEKGREISTLAWLDRTDNCDYSLSAEQTPPRASTSEPEATRMDVYGDQLSRVVKAHDVRFLRSVVTDGAYSTQQCVAGVRGLGLHQIGTWRADAHLRYRDQGPKHSGPGRGKPQATGLQSTLDRANLCTLSPKTRQGHAEPLNVGSNVGSNRFMP